VKWLGNAAYFITVRASSDWARGEWIPEKAQNTPKPHQICREYWQAFKPSKTPIGNILRTDLTSGQNASGTQHQLVTVDPRASGF
jgi:hypothetical protein